MCPSTAGATRPCSRQRVTWASIPALARNAFPGGAIEMIEFHSRLADRRMVADFEQADKKGLKLREKVALAVRLRLTANAAHREAIRRALTILALPVHAPLAARLLYRTVDAIWYAMGDRSTDYNFYTKRALLAGVYSTTLLYWINDKSAGEHGDLGLPRPPDRAR